MASGLNSSRHCTVSGFRLLSAVLALAVPSLQRLCWERNDRFCTCLCQCYGEVIICLSLNAAALERWDRLTHSLARVAVKAPVIFIDISKLKLSALTPSLCSTGRRCCQGSSWAVLCSATPHPGAVGQGCCSSPFPASCSNWVRATVPLQCRVSPVTVAFLCQKRRI